MAYFELFCLIRSTDNRPKVSELAGFVKITKIDQFRAFQIAVGNPTDFGISAFFGG